MTPTDGPTILALGDSLTAGYRLLPGASFAAQLQAELRAHFPFVLVDNAGVSGDTTDGGLRRLPSVLYRHSRKPDLAIVELGANDLLRGMSPARTRANLDAILQELGQCGISTLLTTFEAPRFLGAIGTQYREIYRDLSTRHNVATAPFFPPGVMGHPDLVLPDRIHPNARAIGLVVEGLMPPILAILAGKRWQAA